MRIAKAALLLMAAVPAHAAGQPLFTFGSGFWINLHHFLYVLGRAQNNTPDSHRAAVANAPADTQGFAALSANEREAWQRAIAWYQKNVSPLDAVFDHDLVNMTNALAACGDAPTLTGVKIPAEMRATLEDAAPVYRKVWWERHRVRITHASARSKRCSRATAGRSQTRSRKPTSRVGRRKV